MEKPKFKIHGSYESPENINFDILGLHKELIIASSGFLTDIKYWNNYDGVTYSDLYVHEQREFVVDDASGLAITRKMTISWYAQKSSSSSNFPNLLSTSKLFILINYFQKVFNLIPDFGQ